VYYDEYVSRFDPLRGPRVGASAYDETGLAPGVSFGRASVSGRRVIGSTVAPRGMVQEFALDVLAHTFGRSTFRYPNRELPNDEPDAADFPYTLLARRADEN